MPPNRRTFPVLFLVVLVALGGCLTSTRPGRSASVVPSSGSAQSRPMLIVTTIYPLADWVHQIGGSHVIAQALLKPGSSPHTYEPTPQDSLLLARATGMVSIGLGLETWLQDLAQATGAEAPRLLELGATLDKSQLLKDDPHVWLDPILAARMVREVGRWLGTLDLAHAEEYSQAAEDYAAKIEELLREGKAAMQRVRVRQAVTSHAAFGYLFRRLGIEVIGVIEEQPGREPSSRHIADLLGTMKSVGLKSVFAEPQLSERAAEALAREVGGRVWVLDPIGDASDPQRNTYLGLMRFNIAQIVNALSASDPAKGPGR